MLKKLIKCEYTNNYYYAINTINANEKAELQTIVNKYANIEGDYRYTGIGIAKASNLQYYYCQVFVK